MSLWEFIVKAYSDEGTPSSGRLLSTVLAVVSSWILIELFGHIIGISDLKVLGAWLASIPIIIISLVVFFMSPYAVTKGSASLKDLLDFLRGKKDE